MTAIGGANMAWQLGGDARLLHELASLHDALVLLECRTKDEQPIDVAEILGPGWWVMQDTTDSSKSGTAIAIKTGGKVKRRLVAHALQRVVEISDGNSRVQARYLLAVPIKVGGKRTTLMGAHIPTRSSGKQAEALWVVRRVWRRTLGRKVIFMDGNDEPRAVAETVTAPHFSGNGVMVWAWSQGWEGIKVFWRTVRGSDHRAGSLHVPA